MYALFVYQTCIQLETKLHLSEKRDICSILFAFIFIWVS